MKVHRSKRSRRITHDDPALTAAQDAVIMGRAENPYRPGSALYTIYEEAYQKARRQLPEDYQPEWPRHNRKSKTKT